MKYYIKERHNPQFEKPYYVLMGQLSKAIARRHENSPIYGANVMLPYDSEGEYLQAKEKFESEGFIVHA